MRHFGWIGREPDPPSQWDLRAAGWELCHGQHGRRAECRHIMLVDGRPLSPAQRRALADADRPAWRLLLLGVEQSHERAQLLTGGCAEALPADTSLRELAVRARTIADMLGMLPRWRQIGPLVLDLFHRDARHLGRWIGLHPREFGLLWRLADHPGEIVSRRQLLEDVWRIRHDPETNSVEVHISRLRSKLAACGCAAMVATAPEGGYRLTAEPAAAVRPAESPALPAQSEAPFMLRGGPSAPDDALDAYLRTVVFSPASGKLPQA